MTLNYNVTALQITIYFNEHGDHDHNGLMYALTENVPVLKYIRSLAKVGSPEPPLPGDTPDVWEAQARSRAAAIRVPLPSTPAEARKPYPLVRPLVLRATKDDTVKIKLHNDIKSRRVGLHLVGDGYDVKKDDGSRIGSNPSSLAPYGSSEFYTWRCRHEGVFPFHDAGDYDGGEGGTNVHGLFGTLIVEPAGSIWRDPVSGRKSVDTRGNFRELDGLYLDVLPPAAQARNRKYRFSTTFENYKWPKPVDYPCFDKVAYREFVIFFHDEPEFLPPHKDPPPYPCKKENGDHTGDHNGNNGGHGNGGHGDLPIMPVSYRAEPMINREHILWKRINTGDAPNPPVLNEEQHHSSWMFGDPATPILKAYIGDPVRIRFVHAGVKETHVFHLHLYEWHAVPQDRDSPRIDAISVSPQTGHTIEPVWGAGNRQQVAGDIIWHCHLYPHFHEGMWGMFRTFETLQTGTVGDFLESTDPVYKGRRIGLYPDGTRIERLLPLPDRKLPPFPTPQHPGYPLYIPGTVGQKSPRPPWPNRAYAPREKRFCKFRSLKNMPKGFDYRPVPTDLERNAFNERPVPGELFTRNRFRFQQRRQWQGDPDFELNRSKEVCRGVVVDRMRIDYNGDGWYDKDGHLYYLAKEGHPDQRPGPKEPLFFRANHGQIVNIILRNDLPPEIDETEFDPAFPPCAELPWEGECATHVHMVKFDPVCGDGASTGWNYISAPRIGKKMIYRWWADQEFGTIFFHDHLFANYRQKHGLFGALLVEPKGAEFLDNFSDAPIISGLQARIKVPKRHRGEIMYSWFREFCIGIADFIPMWNRHGMALNPPAHPGGHGDQGVMGLNYRNTPIRERGGDPADWFNSKVHGDPYTTIFQTFANDPIWFRVVQGSHEEQHSFQVHGMRWRRFRANLGSAIRNQQTFGLSEAFTFINEEPYGKGDYLYKLSGADDLWLGCWGIIRAFNANDDNRGNLRPLEAVREPVVVPDLPTRHFHVIAKRRNIVYRNDPHRLTDPYGLVFQVTAEKRPGEADWRPVDAPDNTEPLVLRCRLGEQVKVTVENRLPIIPFPEPYAPQVPLEKLNRPVSEHVSLHADLLWYDIEDSDGANVGYNPEQTIPRGTNHTYTWQAILPPDAKENEQLGAVLLQDMADFRNHRHHGLVGALVVEARNTTPFAVASYELTAGEDALEVWHGTRVTLVQHDGRRTEEIVLLLQDGLRLFHDGDTTRPLLDFPPDTPPDELDKEDQGNKAFNYRTEPVGIFDDSSPSDILGIERPATPMFRVPVGTPVHFHLVGANDKPRNFSFTIHGVTWPEWRFPSEERQPRVASESAISCGSTRTFEFTPEYTGDHAYRSGMLSWAVHQGLWGILRVGRGAAPKESAPARAVAWGILLVLLVGWLTLEERKKK